ncbi:J domain-containing protein required for chloroplast accumulation response 1-like isoform X2 [Arachis stenosperma]|uniref:J domain-containing protein required for chloroplast accumulation response 1-like isoform X2 n=1 Tax=Arachis stenosperma TaxID=217475 RepID=UPI0025ABB566|nr:J domain-containing protein required for chloroplast accumulation response 1-like isoform X2 [Arachis stenosperma]
MDESWRMRMGLTAGTPRRRSMEDRSSSRTWRSIFASDSASERETLDPEDFADVFGGPPRSLLAYKLAKTSSFYEEIFRPSEFASQARAKGGRSLPVFRIPANSDAFYSGVFVSDDERRSRDRSRSESMAKSKSNSSSALSSEDLSPLRPAIGDDVALSSFASKLRPINVPCRWNSCTMMPEEHLIKQGKPFFQCNGQSCEVQYQDIECKGNFKSSQFGFSRKVSSPETISLGSNSCRTMKVTDDFELSSPFSAVSGLSQEPDAKSLVHDNVLPELVIEPDDDDEVMSSYVIEVNSSTREEHRGSEAIDEAIAWAKEKFQSRNSDEESCWRNNGNERSTVVEGSHAAGKYHNEGFRIVRSPKLQIETENLDRDVRLWSCGKETDIRLLLSTLHHILWQESGWYAVPIMSLIHSSQVKKAYQRARLCLHPDKLQQRGATLLQKYIAEKAFSILQVAWTAFISQDVSF